MLNEAADLARACVRDALKPANTLFPPEVHLGEAMDWLRRAQDATGCGGVAAAYTLNRFRRAWRRGWLAAYPETTGYIIPTFIDYFLLTGDPDFRSRAIEMARWEVEVQMESGAVLAGYIDQPPAPAVFNTGQALFGWVAAYRETGEELFLSAAVRAADFLLANQDADGSWQLCSPCTRPGVNTYEARTAWGLVLAAGAAERPEYEEAAIRNLDFVLRQQNPAGWFANCCLSDDERPLLHTISYTIEALLAAGTMLERDDYVTAARTAADALMAGQRADGSLAGRFDASWHPAVSWSCLTGDAQTALVWLRLHELTGQVKYAASARRANAHLCRTQDTTCASPGIRGGIKGSHPIWGPYLRYAYPNWAAKFFADSMMLELALAASPAAQ